MKNYIKSTGKIKVIQQFLLCLDNRKLYITHQIRPKFYKNLENFDLNFRFFFGFPAIFRPRNINLRAEIFNLRAEIFNLSNLANWIKNHCFLYGFLQIMVKKLMKNKEKLDLNEARIGSKIGPGWDHVGNMLT